MPQEEECNICYELKSEFSTPCLTCKHYQCKDCYLKISKCPMCRTPFCSFWWNGWNDFTNSSMELRLLMMMYLEQN